MKPKLRIDFKGTYENAMRFFVWALSHRYDVIVDQNPEVIFFGDRAQDYHFLPFQFQAKKKIFFTGENVRPTYFGYDHAITFDHENSPRHYRLPLYVLEMWARWVDSKSVDSFDWLKNRVIDVELEKQRKTNFASFVVSNPGNKARVDFFQKLNQWKKVQSGGPLFNNIGYVLPRDDFIHKKNFLERHKFNICFENGSYPGYVTEKILDAFYSNTIPIYFGSSTVARDFNPKAFINCHDFIDFVKTGHIETIRLTLENLLQDEQAYYDILTASPLNDNILNEWMQIDNFLNWFDRSVMNG